MVLCSASGNGWFGPEGFVVSALFGLDVPSELLSEAKERGCHDPYRTPTWVVVLIAIARAPHSCQ
jgi:hypothetical protein